MIIDDDHAFSDLISEHILDKAPEIQFSIDWIPDLQENNDLKSYDLYLVDNHINGFPKAKEIISLIRDCYPEACIFIVSGHASFTLLKELINMNISGFIDKENFDITPIINESRKTTLYDKLTELSHKTQELKKTCQKLICQKN